MILLGDGYSDWGDPHIVISWHLADPLAAAKARQSFEPHINLKKPVFKRFRLKSLKNAFERFERLKSQSATSQSIDSRPLIGQKYLDQTSSGTGPSAGSGSNNAATSSQPHRSKSSLTSLLSVANP